MVVTLPVCPFTKPENGTMFSVVWRLRSQGSLQNRTLQTSTHRIRLRSSCCLVLCVARGVYFTWDPVLETSPLYTHIPTFYSVYPHSIVDMCNCPLALAEAHVPAYVSLLPILSISCLCLATPQKRGQIPKQKLGPNSKIRSPASKFVAPFLRLWSGPLQLASFICGFLRLVVKMPVWHYTQYTVPTNGGFLK